MVPVFSDDIPNRILLLAIGVLVVVAPVAILLITLGFLVLAEDLVLGRITLIEFLELYLLDLGLFVAFAYGLYRLTLALVERQLPNPPDGFEFENGEEDFQDASDDRE